MKIGNVEADDICKYCNKIFSGLDTECEYCGGPRGIKRDINTDRKIYNSYVQDNPNNVTCSTVATYFLSYNPNVSGGINELKINNWRV